MPEFSRLSPEEVVKLRGKRQTKLDLTEYREFVNSLDPGDWARVTLEEGESQRTVKRRLTTAAKLEGRDLKYRRSHEGQIIVQLQPPSR